MIAPDATKTAREIVDGVCLVPREGKVTDVSCLITCHERVDKCCCQLTKEIAQALTLAHQQGAESVLANLPSEEEIGSQLQDAYECLNDFVEQAIVEDNEE